MGEVFDFGSMPQFETERLIIRSARADSDLHAFFNLFADPQVAEYTDTGPFESSEDAREVMQWIENIFESRQGMRWALALKDEPDVLIGTAGYNRWYRWNNSGEIGYDLAHGQLGSGAYGRGACDNPRLRIRRNGLEPDRGGYNGGQLKIDPSTREARVSP